MQTEQTSTPTEAVASALPPATGSSNTNLAPSERLVSAFGGAALTVIGLRNLGTLSGITLFLGGGYLLARGLSGYCALNNYLGKSAGVTSKTTSGIEIKSTFIINSPRSAVYAFWRQLENLPRFMQHLDSVVELDDKTSTWTAKIPGGVGSVSWKAEIQQDISGEMISWCSLPGSTVDNAGEVKFKDVEEGKSTELQVMLTYRLPGGDLGSVAGKLFNPAIEKMMRDDLRSFKALMENNGTPTSREGKTTARPDGERTPDSQSMYV